jgi:hypothetical protein
MKLYIDLPLKQFMAEKKIGDTVYERDYGHSMKFTVKTMPEHTTDFDDSHRQFTWVMTDEEGVDVQFLITEGMEHYGPKLCELVDND